MDTVINSEAILADVRQSRCLGKSVRQFKLLKFLLEKSIAGEADTVTQYGIALDVLDRGEDFDPANDSIVRVEMHRLRSALKRYNGISEKYRLILPKGGFNIEVETATQKSEISPPKFGRFGPVAAIALAVVSFGIGSLTSFWNVSEGDIDQVCATYIPNVEARAVGVDQASHEYLEPLLTSMLSQYSSVSVVQNARNCRSAGTPGYIATLNSLAMQDKLSVMLEVRDERTGKAISSRVFDSDKANFEGIEENTAFNYWLASAVSDLANPYGILVREALKEEWNDTAARASFKCLLSMYDEFYTAETDEAYTDSLLCLETAAEQEFMSLDARGSLASTYMDQAKNYREQTIENPMQAAASLIEGSGDNWADSFEMVYAKISYEADRPDYNEERLRSILTQVDAKYSWNGHIKITLSLFYGFKLGEWERAKRLAEQSQSILSVRDSSMMSIETAYAMVQPGGAKDITICEDSYSENSLMLNILVLGCATQLENNFWMEKTNQNLAKLGLETRADKERFVRDRRLDSQLTNALMQAINHT